MVPRPHPGAPTVVLFVRHGTTPTTGKVLPGRAKGLHLSPAGREEAERTARRLHEALSTAGALDRVAALYASPMERARETAAPFARELGIAASVDRDLNECDFGDWTGKRLSALAKVAEWRQVQREPSGFAFPGGESFAQLSARVLGAVRRYRDEHPGSIVVAVSHADPIKVALADAFGAHLGSIHRMNVSTASVSVVAYSPVGASVLALNTNGSLPKLGELGPVSPAKPGPGRNSSSRARSGREARR